MTNHRRRRAIAAEDEIDRLTSNWKFDLEKINEGRKRIERMKDLPNIVPNYRGDEHAGFPRVNDDS